MKKSVPCLFAALLLMALRFAAQPPAPMMADVVPLPDYLKNQLGTPEGTVRAFWQSLGEPLWSATVVKGADRQKFQQYERELQRIGGGLNTSIEDVRIEGTGEQVTAHVTVAFFHNLAWPFFRVSHEERLTLEHAGNVWKIVPANPGQLLEKLAAGGDSNYLLARATALAYPAEIFGFVQQQECASNLKQLALGFMQMLQDYDEKFALNKAAQQYRTTNNNPNMDWSNIPIFAQAIHPYVKSGELFHCPNDSETFISYSFNPNLENIGLGALNEPAQTVLLYEGANGKLNFRHNGTANVVFADGSVKRVDAERAKTLNWKP